MEKLYLNDLDKPGSEYRGCPFWSWNTKLKPDKIVKQIRYFKEMGFGGYHMHPRVGLETEYLGKEYMEAIKLCIEEGRRQQLAACLYDEDRWPSGYGGGHVTRNTEYRALHLLFTTTPYEESTIEVNNTYNANFAAGIRTNKGSLYAVYDVVLDQKGFLEYYRKIDADEKPKGTKWYAYLEENPPHSWYNGGAYVDVLNKEAIDQFIQSIYETYKKAAGDEFGRTVPSIFTDEPHMVYKTNLDTPYDSRDQFMPWTKLLPSELNERYEIEIADCLPEIFWNRKGGCSVRYYFHRILAELFNESYAKNIGSWCEKNGIDFTGHYLYEETLFLQNRSSGDLMSMYRNMDLPGMDLLFDDVAVTTAKQIQSIVHQYEKKGAMSEEYGGTNWSFDFRGYLFQGNWQAALGITLRVPHLSYMSMKGEAKRDFPASIFYQAPWYKEFKQIEDYFARIAYVMKQGKSIVRIAVLHPLESYWIDFGPESQTGMICEEKDKQFLNLTDWLLEANLDFDYLNEALLEELFDGRHFGKMEYDMILLPDLKTIRTSTLTILNQYAKSGGKLILAGNFPVMTNGAYDHTVQESLKGISEQIAFQRASVIEALSAYREVKIESGERGNPEKYIYQLRQCADYCLLFIVPTKKTEKEDMQEKNISVRIKGMFVPYVLEAKNGSISKTEVLYEPGITCIKRTMYAGQTLLLLLKREAEEPFAEGSETVKKWTPVCVENEVAYSVEEPNVVLLDMPEYSIDENGFQKKEEILRIDEKLREQLHFFKRNSSMEQPYRRSKVKKEEHSLLLRYTVLSCIELQEVYLALEDMESTQISWNREKVTKEEIGWYVDEDFRKVRLGKLLMGENILELSIPFNEDRNLEACYLLGEFGVQVEGSAVKVVPCPLRLAWGSIVHQAFGFYGGTISYKLKVNCPEGKLRIQIPKYRGALVGIFIDQFRRGSIIEAPYIFEADNLEPGEHEIEMRLFGNRYNTFSHLHYLNDGKDSVSSPSLWRDRGDNWCYEYNTKPVGILSAPRIHI
ncbi:MAG: glycosyl hydrolase [Lachnospiraceae bacterium]